MAAGDVKPAIIQARVILKPDGGVMPQQENVVAAHVPHHVRQR